MDGLKGTQGRRRKLCHELYRLSCSRRRHWVRPNKGAIHLRQDASAVLPPVETAAYPRRGHQSVQLCVHLRLEVTHGKLTEHQVHIDDLLDLYLRVVEVIVSGRQADDSPYARFYIGSSTEITFRTVAEVYGSELTRLGLLPTAEVESVPSDKISSYVPLLA